MTTINEILEVLECYIDESNVKSVLSHISTICSDKAAHIEASYNDRLLARAWRKASNQIDTCANALPSNPGIGYGN